MKLFPTLLALGSVLTLVTSPAVAAPPFWESNIGDELTALTGTDDVETDVTLSFPFPFEGLNYTQVFVSINGGVQLGGLGTDGEIDYDVWHDLEEFYDDGGFPVIFPFNSDLDLSTTGTIHFKDFGDRAVFTWNEVGTNEDETHLLSFQIQLFADGRIYFSYNGILDGAGEDLLASLDEGIVVGVSGSTGTDPGPVDLSVPNDTDSDTLYEVWNYGSSPSNLLFDLDQQTLAFTPKVGGGFTSKILAPAANLTGKVIPDLLIGKTANRLRGDGIRSRRLATPQQTLIHNSKTYTTNTVKAFLVMQNDGTVPGKISLKSSGDRFPRMTVSALASKGGNVSAAIQTGRFSPVIAPGGSVRVLYSLTTDQYYAGIVRGGDRDDTVRFRLSGGGGLDNAALVNRYK